MGELVCAVHNKYTTMIEYAKALYRAWCQGRSLTDIKEQHEEFIEFCANMLSRTPDEIREELKDSDWFVE